MSLEQLGMISVLTDLSFSLEKGEDDGLFEGSLFPFAFDPSGTEERLVDFDLPGQGRLFFTILGNPFSETFKKTVHCIAVESRQNGDLGGIQIEGKEPDQLPDFGL